MLPLRYETSPNFVVYWVVHLNSVKYKVCDHHTHFDACFPPCTAEMFHWRKWERKRFPENREDIARRYGARVQRRNRRSNERVSEEGVCAEKRRARGRWSWMEMRRNSSCLREIFLIFFLSRCIKVYDKCDSGARGLGEFRRRAVCQRALPPELALSRSWENFWFTMTLKCDCCVYISIF